MCAAGNWRLTMELPVDASTLLQRLKVTAVEKLTSPQWGQFVLLIQSSIHIISISPDSLDKQPNVLKSVITHNAAALTSNRCLFVLQYRPHEFPYIDNSKQFSRACSPRMARYKRTIKQSRHSFRSP